MKHCRIWFGVLIFTLLLFTSRMSAYAYTDEEKAAAKAWLSANGYSPDAGGAAQAYADYMAGKFGKIDGLPDPEGSGEDAVKAEQEAQRAAEERKKAESEAADKKAQKQDDKKEDPDKEKPDQSSEGEEAAAWSGLGQEKPDADENLSETENAAGNLPDPDKVSEEEKEAVKEALDKAAEEGKIEAPPKEAGKSPDAQDGMQDETTVVLPAPSFFDGSVQPVDATSMMLFRDIVNNEATLEEGEEQSLRQKEHNRRMAKILLCVLAGLSLAGIVTFVLTRKSNKD